MQKSLKVAQKTVSSLLKELAVEEAQRLKKADPLVIMNHIPEVHLVSSKSIVNQVAIGTLKACSLSMVYSATR